MWPWKFASGLYSERLKLLHVSTLERWILSLYATVIEGAKFYFGMMQYVN